MAAQNWELPQLSDSQFRFRVGTSVLEEFARSHTPADVLRELVQNEYDAGGTSIEVDFGHDALVVRGTGTPIDENGWQRLSVVLGTGLVGGSTERIAAKVNGVGSKNFGLRSLFLFGDRIYVSSAGHMSVLDRTAGVLDAPLADLTTIDQPGVVLRIPYRTTDVGSLPRFALEQELLLPAGSQPLADRVPVQPVRAVRDERGPQPTRGPRHQRLECVAGRPVRGAGRGSAGK